MLNIDTYAHHNHLQTVAAIQKLIICLSSLAIVTITRDWQIALLTLLIMSSVIVFYAKIPWKVYALLMIAPLTFSVTGVATIVLSFAQQVPQHAIWYYHTPFISLFILENDIWRAFTVMCVSFAATSCLYFLILTTPIYEISPILIRCKLPMVVIELIELMYRFIFLFLNTALHLHTSQQARLGYRSVKTSFRSLGLLISALFRSIFYRYSMMSNAMAARNIEHFIVPAHFQQQKETQPVLWFALTGYIVAMLTVWYW